jgi:hypothetical protein
MKVFVRSSSYTFDTNLWAAPPKWSTDCRGAGLEETSIEMGTSSNYIELNEGVSSKPWSWLNWRANHHVSIFPIVRPPFLRLNLNFRCLNLHFSLVKPVLAKGGWLDALEDISERKGVAGPRASVFFGKSTGNHGFYTPKYITKYKCFLQIFTSTNSGTLEIPYVT